MSTGTTSKEIRFETRRPVSRTSLCAERVKMVEELGDSPVHEVADVRLWVTDGAVHLKTVTAYNDPIELSGDEARRLGQRLTDLADKADRS
jgi:hypothetical protein